MEQGVATVDLGERNEAVSCERAKYQMRNIVWRDKLDLNIGMDCVTLLDKLSKFFDEVNSFELDPNTGKVMPNSEQFAIRMLVDRALNWLITQIAFENIPPIKLTLLSSGDHSDIISALSDDRNNADVK